MQLKTNLYKDLLSLLTFLIISITCFSQNVGISPTGAIPPNGAAGLDVNFTDKGLLIPRDSLISTTSFLPLAAHVAGMIVYNTKTIADVTPGLYYNDGTKWIPCLPKANLAGEMQYWDGITWKTIPAGQLGQKLQLNTIGIPTWAP